MTIREIMKIPHPVLRDEAAPVEKFDPALRALARDMLETMADACGVGLAGPQIGLLQRVFVMRLNPDDERVPEGHPLAGKALVLVNPEILEVSEETEEAVEACLSIPGYAGMVPRPTRVVVQARNEWGKSVTYTVEGFPARVMQHEIDHLDGVLFLDRLEGEEKLFEVAPPGMEDLEERREGT